MVMVFGVNLFGMVAGEDQLAVVRQVTAQFHNVEAAKAAGYELGYLNGVGIRIIIGCIAYFTAGVMGYYYFNKVLIDDLVVDLQKFEGFVYMLGLQGKLKLVVVEYMMPNT